MSENRTQYLPDDSAQNGLIDRSLRTPANPPQKQRAATGDAIISATNRMVRSPVISGQDDADYIKTSGWVTDKISLLSPRASQSGGQHE